ncbi:MAG: hypothetical protein GXZ11_03840 [Tissierellia bacterium]|nr:hypothetical protein [Tissierellia bacterium]
MENLKYISSETYFSGVIVEVTDGSVTIDLKGRLGQFKVPHRMIITDYPLKEGLEVGWVMSFPEVLGPEINEKYEGIIKRQREIEAKKAKLNVED